MYVAVTFLIAPFGFTLVQFRVSEMFNHLVVFNKKYHFRNCSRCFCRESIYSPYGLYDIIFGVLHSLHCLSITIFSAKFISGIFKRMLFNTVVFTFLMCIIAINLDYLQIFRTSMELPFLFILLTVAVGEFVVMAIGIPIMLALNKRLNFKNSFNNTIPSISFSTWTE